MEARTVPKLSPSSRSPPIVVFEDTSQPFLTLGDTVHIGSVARLLNQFVAPPLVIALEVIVLRVFFHGFSKVALAQWNDLGQALGLDGANKSLRIRIQIGASRGKFHCLHAGGLEKLTECLREQRIAIVDEVASSVQESIIGIGEIARNLLHPFSIRLRGNPGNLNPASLEIDNEEHEIPDQACPREHLDAEEIRGRDGFPMGLQKGRP